MSSFDFENMLTRYLQESVSSDSHSTTTDDDSKSQSVGFDGSSPCDVLEFKISGFESFDKDKTIECTVTSCAKVIDDWIKCVLEDEATHRLISFEIQDLLLQNGPKGCRVIGVMEFCYESRCIIILLQYVDLELLSTCMNNFLSDKKNTFVGHLVQTKLKFLMKTIKVQASPLFHDMNNLAVTVYCDPKLQHARPRDIAIKALGEDIYAFLDESTAPYSDWGSECRLSSEQCQYACVEAFIALEISTVLRSRLAGEGRLNVMPPMTGCDGKVGSKSAEESDQDEVNDALGNDGKLGSKSGEESDLDKVNDALGEAVGNLTVSHGK